jgi:hypothetical protein
MNFPNLFSSGTGGLHAVLLFLVFSMISKEVKSDSLRAWRLTPAGYGPTRTKHVPELRRENTCYLPSCIYEAPQAGTVNGTPHR